MNHLISTIKFRDQPLVNCIATSLLAFVLTIPMHELFHLLTFYAYGFGDQVTIFSATCVGFDETQVDFQSLAPFHRIMAAGGSASILNAIIGLGVFFILIRCRMGSMMRVFLIQLMGAQQATGFGYFMCAPLNFGDWGVVFNSFPDAPGLVQTLKIVLCVIGMVGTMFSFFALNYMSYYFIEDPSNKKERLNVALRLHLSMLLVGLLAGLIGGSASPASGGDIFAAIFGNMMWIVFFWGFLFTWFMVKHPKESRFLYPLPQQPYHLLLVIGILLVLIDLIILGPGLVINSK